MSARYRPRQARASPLWQCLHAALPEFILHYAERHAPRLGPFLPERQAALERFLRCGDLSQGFLRVRCEDCDHEYLVPFTCKQRGVCPTCHQRRSVDLAQSIANEICAPVPLRHWVFTIPQLLRPVFRREPRRLGLLARLTADCLTDYLRERCALKDGSPGIVLAFHTFGDYLTFHPHIHVLAIWGCDPFRGPCCGGTMRPRDTVESAVKAGLILEPLGLWDPVILVHVAAPRAPPPSTRWAADGLDGTVIVLEWETHPRAMPDARLPRHWDRWLPAGPDASATDLLISDLPASNPSTTVQALDDQLVLVLDNPDPWAHETEPIFWSD